MYTIALFIFCHLYFIFICKLSIATNGIERKKQRAMELKAELNIQLV